MIIKPKYIKPLEIDSYRDFDVSNPNVEISRINFKKPKMKDLFWLLIFIICSDTVNAQKITGYVYNSEGIIPYFKVENTSKENMAKNRRTRIVVIPNLDKFFAMLDSEGEI